MRMYADVDINVCDVDSNRVRGTIVIRNIGSYGRTTLSWRDYDGGSEDFEEVYDDLPTALLRAALLVACAEGEHGTSFRHSERLFARVAEDFIVTAVS